MSLFNAHFTLGESTIRRMAETAPWAVCEAYKAAATANTRVRTVARTARQ